MPEYAVFSRRLLTGTVSDLPPSARIAWIAILFEAEKLRGRVKLPIRDLAKLASITTPEAAEALQTFLAPDPFSSSREAEGRRLTPIEGETDWYQLVTWEKHVAERQAFFNRLRQQRHRGKKKGNVDDRIAAQVNCDCCGDAFREPYSLYVTQDHDHKTGAARGLICQGCNKVVGMIENGRGGGGARAPFAENYLQRWTAPP